jgi:hypothetical protein
LSDVFSTEYVCISSQDLLQQASQCKKAPFDERFFQI